MKELEKSRNPDDLQKALVDAYGRLPVTTDESETAEEDTPLLESITETFELTRARFSSKSRLDTVNLINELISVSSTTATFKKIIPHLIESVSIDGIGCLESKDEEALLSALQLETSSTGIFSREGGLVAEKVLAEWARNNLFDALTTAIHSKSQDPYDERIFGVYSVPEFWTILESWDKEHQELYGISFKSAEN